MSETSSTDSETLLEGQKVFNGPRKFKEHILGWGDSEEEDSGEE